MQKGQNSQIAQPSMERIGDQPTHPITVTSPLLPNLDEFHQMLQEIFDCQRSLGK